MTRKDRRNIKKKNKAEFKNNLHEHFLNSLYKAYGSQYTEEFEAWMSGKELAVKEQKRLTRKQRRWVNKSSRIQRTRDVYSQVLSDQMP